MRASRIAAPEFDRALFLESLHPGVRRELERTVEPTPHGFQGKAIQNAKTPRRRTPDREEQGR